MIGAGNRLSILKLERDNLVDRWRSIKTSDKAKILVQIMDIDDDIAKVVNEEKRRIKRDYH